MLRQDGTIDWEASALKQAQGYDALVKRMGGGEAPPKTPEEYAPTSLPPGLTLEALKSDPMYTGFLKGAHARGINNAQLGYILEAYAERVTPNPAVAEAELRKDWPDDQSMQRGLTMAYRGVAAYAGSPELQATIDAKFGSDPDFIRFMSRVGAAIGEDRLPSGGLSAAESDTLDGLMGHPGYFDAKHPEHASVVARAKALYAKKHPS